MKKIFTLLSAAMLLSYSYSTAQECFSDWDYRMPITISNGNASALTNHEVKIQVNTASLVSAGKMNATGSDIRFLNSGACCDSLSYFIESGMNTALTDIWVKVPAVPANGTATIYMVYGNAAAPAGSNPAATFSLFDGFDGNALSAFSVSPCGSGTNTVAGGNLVMNWSGSHILVSNNSFPQSEVFMAEAKVNSASGDWPGVHWLKNETTNRGYGILLGGMQVRLSETGSSLGYCQGHNWASALLNYSQTSGIWSTAWLATGSIIAEFPTVAPITSTSTTHTRDSDLQLAIGGISSGTGTINFDWVRARKYAAVVPGFSAGTEENYNANPVSIAETSLVFCQNDSILVEASAGFNAYSWSNGGSGQSVYASSAGTLTVTATNALGCISTDDVSIVASPAVTAAFTSNANLQTLTVSFQNQSTGSNVYEWDFGDGNISSQQNPTHSYAAAGTYTVCLRAMNTDGCEAETCADITINSLGVDEFANAGISFFPNPTEGMVNLSLPQGMTVDNVEILDISGKMVYQNQMNNSTSFTIQELSSGVYVLQISSNQGKFKTLLVKK